MLKKILIILVAILALPFLIAAFVKKDFGVERSVVIDKPVAEVFDYVSKVRNQANYAVWSQIDPDMVPTYTGEDGTVGFEYSWTSEHPNVGNGSQTITQVIAGERIDHALHFMSPFESTADSWIETQAIGEDQTEVTWGFTTRVAYPMNLMLAMMDMEGAIAKDYDAGLSNLQTIMNSDE